MNNLEDISRKNTRYISAEVELAGGSSMIEDGCTSPSMHGEPSPETRN